MFSPQVFAQTVQAPEEGLIQAQLLEDEDIEQDLKEQELSQEQELEQALFTERSAKIKSYYDRHNLPLADYADIFVQKADEYGIDWRLLAAIGFIESTGGKYACQKVSFSAFGWGSCKINFDSYEESIDRISWNLGGHNPKTAYAYKDKSLKEVLYAYNSVIPSYRQKILKEMETIDNQ